MESTWNERLSKIGNYLKQGDLDTLRQEVEQYLSWQKTKKDRQNARYRLSQHTTQPKDEATFWDEFDADLARKVGWGSAGEGCLGTWAFEKMCDNKFEDAIALIKNSLNVSLTEPLQGLVLGCGDMMGEHTFFVDPRLPFAQVDAYDISLKSMQRGQEITEAKGLNVNYQEADMNTISLPKNRYALIIVSHSYHHFEEIDHITQEINKALLPGGVFYTVDYVGARKLQWTDLQLHYARQILQLLPSKYRRDINGKVKTGIERVPPETFSPDEAICSDLILPAMDKYLNVEWQHNWAGLLYPLLEGIAFNFSTSDEDMKLLKFLFDLDFALCQSNLIEPNFTFTLATKRKPA